MTSERTEKAITLFDIVGKKEREQAIKSILSGKTPIAEVKEREGRGSKMVDYVNT